jgi:serine/threonine-protein kinase
LSIEVPQLDEFVGMVFDGRYRVESRIGRGGMGVVYAARHVMIDKPVAIKVLRREYSSDPSQVERFIREARAASRIGHPNIVDVTDFGTLPNGQVFFVMEFLPGLTLAHELRAQGALPPWRCLAIAMQVGRALAAAHAKGIVHRDLKPGNIFIVNPSTDPGLDAASGHQVDVIKLLDFGIAKITWDQTARRLTKVGSIFGTPQYMSPEQAAGKDADHRGDIYALGCIIYEILTGEVPFVADTFMGTLTKQLFDRPVPPRELRPDLRIDPAFEQVILRALEKNPDDRFQSTAEMIEALSACRERGEPSAPDAPTEVVLEILGLPAVAPPQVSPIFPSRPESETDRRQPSAAPPSLRRVARTRTWIAAGSGVAALGLLAFAVGHFVRSPSSRSAPDASGARLVRPDLRLATDVRAVARARGDASGPTTTISIETVPSGARVLLGPTLLGSTPFSMTVTLGTPQTYVVRKRGFEDHEVRSAGAPNERIVVSLQRERRTSITAPSKRRQTDPETAFSKTPPKASDLRPPKELPDPTRQHKTGP